MTSDLPGGPSGRLDRLDATARKELLARMVLEKRVAGREKRAADITLQIQKEEKRWQPLSNSYLCSCMDVKRGFAIVCPPHMLSFH